MYCKGCNSLLEENDSICPKCGLDNDRLLEETTEIYLNKISNPKDYKNKKNNKSIIIILVFILAIVIICLYIFRNSKKAENNNNPTTTTSTIAKLGIFKFDNLQLKYDNQKYGTSTNTIFLKENNNINIILKSITFDEYKAIINSNEVLDDKLGEVDTKTYADLNKYYHTFINNEKYYLIEVNYGDFNNENIQLELSRIIESLH